MATMAYILRPAHLTQASLRVLQQLLMETFLPAILQLIQAIWVVTKLRQDSCILCCQCLYLHDMSLHFVASS